MFRSYRVGRVFGIPLEIDITFLLVLPVFAWLVAGQLGTLVALLNGVFGLSIAADALRGGALPLAVGFAAVIGLFVGVLLHELGHSLVAMYYGYGVDSITLWLLGGIAQPAEQPRNWVHEFWIAIAGPVVSVLLGVGCYLAVLVIPSGPDVAVFLLAYLAVLNVVLAVFNMLPAFPLDGGRVLRALLARRHSYVRATRQAATVGKLFAVVLGLVGLVALNVFWIFIAFFIYVAATAESKQMVLDAAFQGVTVEELMTPRDRLDVVAPGLAVGDLLDEILATRHTGYPVVDAGEFVGIVTLSDVQQVDDETVTVGEVMTPAVDLDTVGPDDDAVDAFQTLGSSEVGRLPVVDDAGRLFGLVTRTDLVTAFKAITQQQRIEDPMPLRRGA
jgi:Zn-dependent protease/CBS domain-containing protein